MLFVHERAVITPGVGGRTPALPTGAGAALAILVYWRFRFLVALPCRRNLLLYAKHLLVAAKLRDELLMDGLVMLD